MSTSETDLFFPLFRNKNDPDTIGAFFATKERTETTKKSIKPNAFFMQVREKRRDSAGFPHKRCGYLSGPEGPDFMIVPVLAIDCA